MSLCAGLEVWIPRNADDISAAQIEVLFHPPQLDESVLWPDRIDDGDRPGNKPVVVVLLEPIEREARGACSVEARCHHDDQLVRKVQYPARRRIEDARSCVEQNEVVVMFEQLGDATIVVLLKGPGDSRVVVGRDHLQASRSLRGERPDVRVAIDLVGLPEKIRHGRCCLSSHPIAERASIGIPVESYDAISPVGSEGVTETQSRCRLAYSALSRDHCNAPTAAHRTLDSGNKLAFLELSATGSNVDQAAT